MDFLILPDVSDIFDGGRLKTWLSDGLKDCRRPVRIKAKKNTPCARRGRHSVLFRHGAGYASEAAYFKPKYGFVQAQNAAAPVRQTPFSDGLLFHFCHISAAGGKKTLKDKLIPDTDDKILMLRQ